ncbi:Zinc finger BED domain-containing protein RICESLEEPER 3 [Euphorbia peplus]|nr:Zinc finger BED domain-containing protein RICESLEEPER 3 [Euphorbia peplus]
MTDNTSSCPPSSIPAISSTPIVEEYNVHIDDENEAEEENEEHPDDSLKETNDGDSSHPFKRARKSDVWKDLEDLIQVGGVWKTKCHFVDRNWKLQKRVLSFVHLPPPRKGKDIANSIFKCLTEWGIENKVFTVSVDNASANDSCIQITRETFSLTKRLVCGGKIFHGRCCAHILNIMVQHGLKQVKSIIKNVHDTMDYLNGSEQRLQKFVELVHQFNLKERKLILECKTRWNFTYDMLACAINFKEVFSRLALEDSDYVYCPSVDDWDKIQKLLEILKVFYDTTNIISGSTYPTSNLFLSEVYYIKEMLDKHSDSSDDFVRSMVKNMKERFDKYWGECNLLMAISGVLDPRLKMKVIVRENANRVRNTLHELYDEYKGTHTVDSQMFDVLEWWKDKSYKYRILSKLAADVLAISITTVASESTFSAGSRVIDSYRCKLKPKTVEMLICTSDWLKANYGVKNHKVDDLANRPVEIILHIP